MEISIIGAGKVGGTLAAASMRAGHRVTVSAKNPEHARAVAQQTGARVVKAFNTAFAARMAAPVVGGLQLDGFVAGDDEGAKAKVLELVGSIGFRPLDAGPLEMARTLEALALLNIKLQLRNKWPWQSGWKLVGPTGT